MLLLAFVGIGALLVPLAGGRLSRLADVRIRRAWVLVATLAAQILIISVLPGGSAGFHRAVHALTYVAAGYIVWCNRDLPGILLVGAGGAMNAIAIFSNGGVMPASPWAQATAGLAGPGAVFANSAAVAHPKLAFLGDVFPVPASWPLHNVFSAGDILIVIGAMVAMHRVCGSRLGLRPTRAHAAASA
jgi:hypothetical protein